MKAGIFILVGFAICQPWVLGKSTILQNPVDQNLGDWGKWDECPNNTYASGFQLKVENFQGETKDDSAVNGIRLICSSIGQNNFNSKMPSSLVGNRGRWRGVIYCDRGTMTGFQLRSEKDQGEQGDDTAANNLKAYCAQASGKKVWREGDGANAGEYSEQQLCKPMQAIRAIRTQVDQRKNADQHGLVNVEMRCDDIEFPEKKCVPETKYDLLLECNNILGVSELNCGYTSQEGVSKSTVASTEMSQEQSTLSQIGITAEASSPIVQAQVSSEKTWSSNFGECSSELSQDFWNSEVTRSVDFQLPPQAIARVYQLTSSCGVFEVGSPEFVISQRNGDLPNPIPKKGFVCKEPQGGARKRRRSAFTGQQRQCPSRVKYL